MYTIEGRRCAGIGTAMLKHICAEAVARGARRLNLETGSWDYFKSAVSLYRQQGFTECEPFGDYKEDSNSFFMTRSLP